MTLDGPFCEYYHRTGFIRDHIFSLKTHRIEIALKTYKKRSADPLAKDFVKLKTQQRDE